MKRLCAVILALIFCFSLTACGNTGNHEGEAKTPSGSSVMKGKDYKEVIEEFESKGFTNIKAEKIEDLITGWLTKDGEVEDVSVGGDVDYSPDKWVSADIEVVIRYHTFPVEKKSETDEANVEGTSIVMGVDSSAYVGKSSVDVEMEFKEQGFTNIKINQVTTTDTTNVDGQVTSISANADSFKKGDSFEKDAEIIINCWKVEKPISEYEKAFVRKMSYNLYYMFDTDNKTVVYFGTNDTYIEKGTYTGDFATGVTINWSHGEWTEKFIHAPGSSKATLVDGNGYDWSYDVCDVVTAQKELDKLQ